MKLKIEDGRGPLIAPLPFSPEEYATRLARLRDCQRRSESAAAFRSKSAARAHARRPPISGAFWLNERFYVAAPGGSSMGSSALARRDRRLE